MKRLILQVLATLTNRKSEAPAPPSANRIPGIGARTKARAFRPPGEKDGSHFSIRGDLSFNAANLILTIIKAGGSYCFRVAIARVLTIRTTIIIGIGSHLYFCPHNYSCPNWFGIFPGLALDRFHFFSFRIDLLVDRVG